MATIYQLLVQDCGETLAIFAYAVYKQHKVEVLNAIHDEKGRAASQDELDAFHQIACASSTRTMYILRAETLMKQFMKKTLNTRTQELESKFQATKIGKQLNTIQSIQQQKRSWKGWAADVSANLAVNFATILVIAALLFGFRGLDTMLSEFGRDSGVLRK